MSKKRQMVAAFTADYMKAVKSRSVAGGVGPRLLNHQSLNLRATRAQERRCDSAGGRKKGLQCVFCVYLLYLAMQAVCVFESHC